MPGKSPATFAILGINVLVFGLLAWQQQSVTLDRGIDLLAFLQWGANFNPLTTGNEPYRLVASMFLHGGILHLAMNMYALYVLGKDLEPAAGTLRFVLLYFFSGMVGGLFSLEVTPFAISVGASGALFGLYGYRLTADVIGSHHDKVALRAVIVNFVIFVMVNVIITLQWSHVDWAAHVGGALAGMLLGIFHVKMRWFIHNGALAALTLAVPFTLVLLPDTQRQYYDAYQQLLETEDRRDRVFDAAKTDRALRDSLVLIKPSLDSVAVRVARLQRVPMALRNDTAILRRYAHWRATELRYRIEMIDRESYVYLDSLGIVDEKIATLPPLTFHLDYRTPVLKPEKENEPATGQVPLEPVTVYYDSHWRVVSDQDEASYYRIGTRDSLGRWQGWVRDHYKNHDIQMRGYYKDNIKDGVFLYYSDHGTYTSAGRYEKEQSVGRWEVFHWNGKLHRETYYHQGAFTRTVWDSLGQQQVVEGHGTEKTWYSNGALREEGAYANGKREGLWRGYHPDGSPFYQEYYQRGQFVRGKAIAMDGRRYEYDVSSVYPLPPGGMGAYKKYIDQNKIRPYGLPLAGGVVKVVFDVMADGLFNDFVILQSAGQAFDREAIRLIKQGPRWRPALLQGHVPVPAQGYVEVAFE